MAMGGGRMIRGTVTSATPTQLTVKTEAGEVYQVIVTPNTQVRKGRDPMKIADVHSGDAVGAMGVLDAPNKTVHAMMIAVVDAEQIRKAREALGKTWIAGKITAIDEVKLTIMRSDNVSQVIEVDEDTSFRKGGRGMRNMMGDGAGFGGGYGGGNGQGGRRGQGGAEADQGESITLADVKVGDMVAGPGALKGGVFVPTQLQVMDPAAARPRRRNPDGAVPAATPPPTNTAGTAVPPAGGA
jgi:hypothetical protein